MDAILAKHQGILPILRPSSGYHMSSTSSSYLYIVRPMSVRREHLIQLMSVDHAAAAYKYIAIFELWSMSRLLTQQSAWHNEAKASAPINAKVWKGLYLIIL
jgi:hypothetical protein